MQNQENKREKRKLTLPQLKLIVGSAALVVLTVLLTLGLNSVFRHDEKPTHLGFEDIGELATQAAYLTIVEDIDASRELFGVKIPFTQTEIIYSYDVAVKAGLDFDQVEWEVNDEAKKRNPGDHAGDPGTEQRGGSGVLQALSRNWSNFRPIRTEEFSAAAQAMKVEAQNRAVENGLLGRCPGKCRAGDPGLYPPRTLTRRSTRSSLSMRRGPLREKRKLLIAAGIVLGAVALFYLGLV